MKKILTDCLEQHVNTSGYVVLTQFTEILRVQLRNEVVLPQRSAKA